jgi:quinol monooxygenase YgiN
VVDSPAHSIKPAASRRRALTATMARDVVMIRMNQRKGAIMQRRRFVGSSLALGATWPLRGVASVLKGAGEVPAKSLSGGEPVQALTFIEVTVTARGHAAGILRERANVLREHHTSPGQIIVMQETARPERFVVLERETPTVSTAAKTATHALTDGLMDDLTAPPDERLTREFDEPGTAPTQQVDARANFYVLAHVDIAPQDRPGVESSLRRFAAAARRSDGNFGFEILQQANRPNHFNLISAWLGESPFRAFAASAAAREFRQTIGPLLGSPYDERLLRRVD